MISTETWALVWQPIPADKDLLFTDPDTFFHSNKHSLHVLLPPLDKFYADPFIITYKNQEWIFFEEWSKISRKGHISCIALDKSGKFVGDIIPVLQRQYHLSYPFIIQDQGELYMIPETNQSRRVELYKCIQFPDQWELDTILMKNIQTADTTIYVKEGIYWMFTSVRKYSYKNVTIFWAPTLRGPWTRHAYDSGFDFSARQGGNIIDDNIVYRVSQKALPGFYGKALILNQVLVLDIENYVEKKVYQMDPWVPFLEGDRESLGTHHLSMSKNTMVSDIKYQRLNPDQTTLALIENCYGNDCQIFYQLGSRIHRIQEVNWNLYSTLGPIAQNRGFKTTGFLSWESLRPNEIKLLMWHLQILDDIIQRKSTYSLVIESEFEDQIKPIELENAIQQGIDFQSFNPKSTKMKVIGKMYLISLQGAKNLFDLIISSKVKITENTIVIN